jgi:peptidoglycan hydrolase-like protein with peptidoglycan-binding domain
MNMRRHLALASATAVLGGGLAIAPAASAGAVTARQTGKFWKNHGYKVDGIFGPNTERAVKYHQSKAHILVDGKVGKQTWKTLRTYKC